jgi:hypothetical protein
MLGYNAPGRQCKPTTCTAGVTRQLTRDYRDKAANVAIWRFDAALVLQICHLLKQSAKKKAFC